MRRAPLRLEERVANEPIKTNRLENNKDHLVFLSHKSLKIKLSSAQVTKRQYIQILKILRELEILFFTTRGVHFISVRKVTEK